MLQLLVYDDWWYILVRDGVRMVGHSRGSTLVELSLETISRSLSLWPGRTGSAADWLKMLINGEIEEQQPNFRPLLFHQLTLNNFDRNHREWKWISIQLRNHSFLAGQCQDQGISLSINILWIQLKHLKILHCEGITHAHRKWIMEIMILYKSTIRRVRTQRRNQ